MQDTSCSVPDILPKLTKALSGAFTETYDSVKTHYPGVYVGVDQGVHGHVQIVSNELQGGCLYFHDQGNTQAASKQASKNIITNHNYSGRIYHKAGTAADSGMTFYTHNNGMKRMYIKDTVTELGTSLKILHDHHFQVLLGNGTIQAGDNLQTGGIWCRPMGVFSD